MTQTTDIQQNDRIYFSGDMANQEGFGSVTAIDRSGRFGDRLTVTMDDERTFSLTRSAFSSRYEGHGGTRFVLESAYYEWRAARLAELERR